MASTNRRISRPRSRTAKALAKSEPAPKSVQELTKMVNRLEVDIAATSRLAFEEKRRRGDTLPPPEGMMRRARPIAKQTRLMYQQERSRRRKQMLQAAMFLTTLVLFAGAAAWVYKLWQAAP